MPRNVKLVRDQVNALYLKHRSGREVARVIGIEWRTLKRWLLRFAVQGIPIPEESKGDYLTRSKLKKSREKAQEKASKKKGVA
jgi:transposase